MGRAPCCDKASVKKGPWSPEEDAKLRDYIEKQGTGGNWIALPRKAGLKRCGKSCRLRWLNYLRPNIKHGEFSDDEDRIIYTLFANIGSRWSVIAAHLPGRTDNDIKNYWNTKLKKKLMRNYQIGGPPGNIPARHSMPSSTLEQRDLFSAFPAASIPSSSNSDVYKLSPLSSSSSSSFTIPQPRDHQTFLGPFTMYGHEAASCSSSDGSFSGDRDHIHRQLHLQQVPNSDLQCFSSSYYENDILAGDQEIVNYGSSSTTPLDYYGIEEIKQLTSSTSSFNLATSNSNNNYCSHNSFLFDVDNSSISGSVADLATRADEGFLYY